MKNLTVVAAILLVMGCSSALVIGDRTVGYDSEGFFIRDGFLKKDYAYGFGKVWDASELALKDLKAGELISDKRLSRGELKCTMSGEKVRVLVEYAGRETTTVAVRVGLSGDQIAAQLIHERINSQISR